MLKTILRYSSILLLILLCTFKTEAQDSIYLNSGRRIIGDISETTKRQVKLKIFDLENSPIVILRRGNIKGIKYNDGQIIGQRYFMKYHSGKTKNRFVPSKSIGLNIGSAIDIDIRSQLSIDYFIKPEISIVGNALFDTKHLGSDIGMNYYFLAHRFSRIKPYIGVFSGIWQNELLFGFPLGITLFSNRGFTTGFGVKIEFLSSNYRDGVGNILHEFEINPKWTIQIGWRFKK